MLFGWNVVFVATAFMVLLAYLLATNSLPVAVLSVLLVMFVIYAYNMLRRNIGHAHHAQMKEALLHRHSYRRRPQEAEEPEQEEQEDVQPQPDEPPKRQVQKSSSEEEEEDSANNNNLEYDGFYTQNSNETSGDTSSTDLYSVDEGEELEESEPEPDPNPEPEVEDVPVVPREKEQRG